MFANRLALVLSGLLTLATLASYAEDFNEVWVYSGWPLRSALSALSENLGVETSFEAPLLQYAPDMQTSSSNTFVLPKGEKFYYQYAPTEDAFTVIGGLVNQYNAATRTIQYQMEEVAGVYCVYPAACADAAGVVREYESRMDIQISVSIPRGALTDSMEALCQAISTQTVGPAIRDGSVYMQLEGPPINAAGVRALEILCNMVQQVNSAAGLLPGRRISWNLVGLPPVGIPAKDVWFLSLPDIDFRNPKPIRMYLASKRPVQTALEIMGDRMEFSYGYEDPPFLCECDINYGNPKGYYIDAGWERDESPEAILQKVIEGYPKQRFEFDKDGERFWVYPVEAKDVNGNMGPVQPVMKTPVSVDVKGLSGAAALDRIGLELSAATGNPIHAEPLPEAKSPFATATVKDIPAGPMEAGALLNSILEVTDPALSWELLYDPSNDSRSLVLIRPGEHR